MTLIKFTGEYFCSVCGRVERESKVALPFCCGKLMLSRPFETPEQSEDLEFRADLVKMNTQVLVRPNWVSQREVWSFRRRGENDVSKERIGLIGKTDGGRYEFIMGTGFSPGEGSSDTMQDAVQKMLDIASK